jgi:hypothetical protein
MQRQDINANNAYNFSQLHEFTEGVAGLFALSPTDS